MFMMQTIHANLEPLLQGRRRAERLRLQRRLAWIAPNPAAPLACRGLRRTTDAHAPLRPALRVVPDTGHGAAENTRDLGAIKAELRGIREQIVRLATRSELSTSAR